MTLVYGLLYTLISSEDYAVQLGAIVFFAALAAVMIATRRIDWARLQQIDQRLRFCSNRGS